MLLGGQLLAARLRGGADTAPLFGVVMATIVAFSFMQVRSGPGLIRVAAMTGAFWLVILLGLGSLDPLTRADHPISMRTPVSR